LSIPNNATDITSAEQIPLVFYQIKPSCPFQKCGLEEMQGKKWESIEDAGILLCTKAPV